MSKWEYPETIELSLAFVPPSWMLKHLMGLNAFPSAGLIAMSMQRPTTRMRTLTIQSFPFPFGHGLPSSIFTWWFNHSEVATQPVRRFITAYRVTSRRSCRAALAFRVFDFFCLGSSSFYAANSRLASRYAFPRMVMHRTVA